MKRSILALVLASFAAFLVANPCLSQAASVPGKAEAAAPVPAKPEPAPGAAKPDTKVAPAPLPAKPDTKSAPTPGAANPDVKVAPAPAPANPNAKPALPAKPVPAVVDSLGLLERAVAKDSTKFDNLYRLGVLYLDRDRVNEAVRVLTKAHSLRPKNHKVLVNLGAAYDAAGQPAAAQKYYKEALAISPNDSVATCRLASSLYAQANYKDAMKLLRTMIGKGTGAYCAYFTLGVAFADAGIYKDAIRMWKKVVELAPNSSEANSAKESIEVLEKFVKK